MQRSTGTSFLRLAAVAVALLSTLATTDFVDSYCSTQNTGSTDEYTWQWQSNGNCTGHCNGVGTYAFAVIQYTDCWCSNYIPASQVDKSRCQVDCPGYPAEKCGDKDNGLYIYIELSGSPSGTQAGSSSVSSTTSISSSTATTSSTRAQTPAPASSTVVTSAVTVRSSTVAKTVTATTSAAAVRSTTTSVSSVGTRRTSTTLRTVATNPATTEQPTTLSTVVTESGVVVTRTVVITPTSIASETNSGDNKSNTGAVVGGAVGGVLGLLAIIGGVIFLLWRRRKQQRERDGQDSAGITRNTSTMSKAGLLGGHGVEKDLPYPAPLVTNMGSQRSRQDDSSISPMTASDRRYSQPVLVDSRLNPRAVLTFHGSNESRDSLTSIDDSRDYGRQLNVVNPDTNRD